VVFKCELIHAGIGYKFSDLIGFILKMVIFTK